jgi:hypothetical protein
MTSRAAARQEIWTLPVYVVWAAGWYGFFLFAASVRIPSMLWEPVFLWVFAQVSLMEPWTTGLGRAEALGLISIAYVASGCLLWVVVESKHWPSGTSVWKRSGIAWAILVISSILVAFLLLEWS